MAKDRFSNQKRNNYQKTFIAYTPAVKKTLVFSKEQRELIGNMLKYYKSKLNEWEIGMLDSMTKSATYSPKQKEILNRIYKKLKNN
jgi:hypothetical protein